MNKIKALIINRNLLTTLKNTVDFLKKESRVDPWIIDNDSSYPPLLEYYKTNPCNIHYHKANKGPHAIWNSDISFMTKGNFYIVADADCTYDEVPDDWLDVMMSALTESTFPKVGFSLEIEDLPNTEFGNHQKSYQKQFWQRKNKWGWEADIDTTFALYKPDSGFNYTAIRLDKPYCVKHIAWYLTRDNISDEWRYYLNNSTNVATCKKWFT